MQKKQKNVRHATYDLDGFDPDVLDRGFDRQVYYRDGFNQQSFNRNEEFVDTGEKIKQELKINPWDINYAQDKHKNSDEVMKQCIELQPITNQYFFHQT